MHRDRYGNPLTTRSQAARDEYVAGLDSLLSAAPGTVAKFEAAIAADDTFAMAHAGLARAHQMFGRMAQARSAMETATALAAGVSDCEAGHLSAFGDLFGGRTGVAYGAMRAHLSRHPRDAIITQTCLGVFSLIGFSGQAGREAENLALAEILAPAYGDDWFFLGYLAFAQMEVGQTGPAGPNLDRALALNPRNANSAHVRAHLYYELGETGEGRAFLTEWMTSYDRAGLMHCHNSWHLALWALAEGDAEAMWAVVDRDLQPDLSTSPTLNILTDLASLYYRAELAGLEVPHARWGRLSDYALEVFPKPGLGFADVHAALAHAMAGEGEALQRIVRDARGPAEDMVRHCAVAFGALATKDWAAAVAELTVVMADHARLGGSRAQRDLIEFAMLGALIRIGKADEARRLIAMRRPGIARAGVVSGL